MAKEYRLVDPFSAIVPSTSRSEEINWTLCALCQEKTKETLTCPAKGNRDGQGYCSLADSFIKFNDYGHDIPLPVDPVQLNDGSGIQATLGKHCASWHKSCRDKVSKRSFDRLNLSVEKRKSDDSLETCSHKKTRQNVSASVAAKDACFFCGVSSGELHKASTFDLDSKV